MEARYKPKTLKEFCQSVLDEFQKLPTPQPDFTLITQDSTLISDTIKRKDLEDRQRNELLKYVADANEYDDLVNLLKLHLLDKEANKENLTTLINHLKDRWQDKNGNLLLVGPNGHDLDYTGPKLRISQACYILAQKLGEAIPDERGQPQHPYTFLMPSFNLEMEYRNKKRLKNFPYLHQILIIDCGLPTSVQLQFEDFAKYVKERRVPNISISENSLAATFMNENHMQLAYQRMQNHSHEAKEYFKALVDGTEEEQNKACKRFIEALNSPDYCVTATYSSQGVTNLARYLLRRSPDKLSFIKALADVKYLHLRHFKLFLSSVPTEDLCRLMLDVNLAKENKTEEEYETALLGAAMLKIADLKKYTKVDHLNTKQLCAYAMCLLPIYSRYRLTEDKPEHTSRTASLVSTLWKPAPTKEDKQKYFNLFWDFLVAVGEDEKKPNSSQTYHLTKEDLKIYLASKLPPAAANDVFSNLTDQPRFCLGYFNNNLTTMVNFFCEAGIQAKKYDNRSTAWKPI